jgi:hypothetical protein
MSVADETRCARGVLSSLVFIFMLGTTTTGKGWEERCKMWQGSYNPRSATFVLLALVLGSDHHYSNRNMTIRGVQRNNDA